MGQLRVSRCRTETSSGTVPIYEALERVSTRRSDVSRGGSLLARWMVAHERENPLYERFDDVLAILRAHDVSVSLGDGPRPERRWGR